MPPSRNPLNLKRHSTKLSYALRAEEGCCGRGKNAKVRDYTCEEACNSLFRACAWQELVDVIIAARAPDVALGTLLQAEQVDKPT